MLVPDGRRAAQWGPALRDGANLPRFGWQTKLRSRRLPQRTEGGSCHARLFETPRSRVQAQGGRALPVQGGKLRSRRREARLRPGAAFRLGQGCGRLRMRPSQRPRRPVRLGSAVEDDEGERHRALHGRGGVPVGRRRDGVPHGGPSSPRACTPGPATAGSRPSSACSSASGAPATGWGSTPRWATRVRPTSRRPTGRKKRRAAR